MIATISASVIILLCIAASVIAQSDEKFSHTVYYDIGGRIFIDRELGQTCNTGAVKRQTIIGFGEVRKAETVKIAANIMTVDETLDWNVPADALGNLRVTSTIQLCSRPMSTVAEVYNIDENHELKVGDIINTYHPLVVEGKVKVNPVTTQIWAAALTTNQGHEGSLHSDFKAAYGPGPYEDIYGAIDQWGETFYYDSEYLWTYKEGIPHYDRDHRRRGYKRGDYYVGNYFTIEQYAYTSEGSLRRYISMSSPFENTVLIEEHEVIGRAAVREAFELKNLIGGPKAVTLAWYELF